MARLLTLRRTLARLLTPDEVDDNIVNVATDFTGETDPAALPGAAILPSMRWADTGAGWLKRRNAANNNWVKEHRLYRTCPPIFDMAELPANDQGPIFIRGEGMAEWDSAMGVYRVLSQIPVGQVSFWPLRESIPAGRFPLDGQIINRATAPDLVAMVVAGLLPVAAEATWQSDPSQRGKYTLGDGSTTIRLPDYNGKASGSLGALFLRGDGALSSGAEGVIQRDALQGHWHSPVVISSGGTAPINVPTTAVQNMGGPSRVDIVGNFVGSPISDGANGTPRTAVETRPNNVTGVWVVNAFGVVTNPGSVDAAQLASDLAVTQSLLTQTRNQLFGVGQILRPRTTAIQAWYQNTSNRPIEVSTLFVCNASGTVNLVTAGYLNNSASATGMYSYEYKLTTGATSGTRSTITMNVPPGIWWMVDAVNAAANSSWEYS